VEGLEEESKERIQEILVGEYQWLSCKLMLDTKLNKVSTIKEKKITWNLPIKIHMQYASRTPKGLLYLIFDS